MANEGQPTVREGDTGEPVRRVQRAANRPPSGGPSTLVVDGIFGAETKAKVIEFQQFSGLTPDGIVGPLTWAKLPDGGPMPTLQLSSTGDVVRSLQQVLSERSSEWGVSPGPVDGVFGPQTRAAVEAFQHWGNVAADGIVGDQTWSVNMAELAHSLEDLVGLQYVIN